MIRRCPVMSAAAVVAAGFVLTSAANAAAPVDWSAAIGRLEHYCYDAKPMSTLNRRLYDFVATGKQAPARLTSPGLPAAVQILKIKDDGDAYGVQVAMPGVYAGLPIFGAVFEIGKENGISAFELFFDADQATVERTLADMIATFKRNNQTDEEGASLDVRKSELGVALVCDQSN